MVKMALYGMVKEILHHERNRELVRSKLMETPVFNYETMPEPEFPEEIEVINEHIRMVQVAKDLCVIAMYLNDDDDEHPSYIFRMFCDSHQEVVFPWDAQSDVAEIVLTNILTHSPIYGKLFVAAFIEQLEVYFGKAEKISEHLLFAWQWKNMYNVSITALI